MYKNTNNVPQSPHSAQTSYSQDALVFYIVRLKANYGLHRENLQPHYTTKGQSLLRDLQDHEFRKRSHDLFKLLQDQAQVSVDITTIISIIVAHYSNSLIHFAD